MLRIALFPDHCHHDYETSLRLLVIDYLITIMIMARQLMLNLLMYQECGHADKIKQTYVLEGKN